ncbi:unnamed protein product [Lupinus luteus]|uniref:Uncharacterized protein n=1 Tax=Lupinus luteus TaxID=3873 RepID=A0AAV1W3Y4_LUPLU
MAGSATACYPSTVESQSPTQQAMEQFHHPDAPTWLMQRLQAYGMQKIPVTDHASLKREGFIYMFFGLNNLQSMGTM